ncbi:MAG: hypothetical protein HEQ23_11335 [Tepidisphaera sp.]
MRDIDLTFNLFLQLKPLEVGQTVLLAQRVAATVAEILPKLKLVTNVWNDLDEISIGWPGERSTPITELAKARFWTRSLDAGDDLCMATSRPIGGRNSPYAFVIDIERDARSVCEIRDRFQLGSTLRVQLIPQALKLDALTVLQVFTKVIEEASSLCGAEYGFVHVDDYHRAPMNGFWVYPTTEPIPELTLSMNAWCYGMDPPEIRRERVYGIYWGNYLGPQLAKKAGKPRDIGDDYVEVAMLKNKEGLVTRFKDGGVFLCLYPNIELWDSPPESPPGGSIHNATWLQRRFRACGMW